MNDSGVEPKGSAPSFVAGLSLEVVPLFTDDATMNVDHAELEVEHRRLQERYAEIASLAGGLAHEIRNPLSTIVLSLDLMAEDLEEAETQRDRRLLQKVNTVRKECDHLERILEDFLQFARVGRLTLEPTDLNEVVREFIEFYQPLAAEQRVEISPHLGIDLPPVLLDRQLWRQVLQNLSRNAAQAMPDGGVLELQTFARDGRVVLEIIDTGQGMDAATQARMFETFYSTRSQGSGLGLPTVRKIVEGHHGEIDCESAVGRGTRFVITLPALLP